MLSSRDGWLASSAAEDASWVRRRVVFLLTPLRLLASSTGLRRCGKSCRLRWTNYLRPDIKRGKFTLQEEQTIIQLHALLGNR